jgi:hypothetical protein
MQQLKDECWRRQVNLMFGQSSTGKWHLLENGVCYCGPKEILKWQAEHPKTAYMWQELCFPCFRAIYNKNKGWGTPYSSPGYDQRGYKPYLNCYTMVRQRKGKKRKRCRNSVSDFKEFQCPLHKRTTMQKHLRHFSGDVGRMIYSFLWKID